MSSAPDVNTTYTTFLTEPRLPERKNASGSLLPAPLLFPYILGCTQAPDPAALSLDIKDHLQSPVEPNSLRPF